MPTLSLRCCLAVLLMGPFAPPVLAQVADPGLSASAGPTAETVTVTVAPPVPGVALYYTTDGTPPTTSSAQVPGSGTLVIDLDSTLKVRAYQGSAAPSNVVTARYTSHDRLTSGSQHSLLLKKDGTLWAWGNNASGQLGTATSRPSQVPFTGASPILGIVSTTVPFANGVAQNPAYDGDSDGLPDAWERQHFGNTSAEANADPDGDGLTNVQEYQQGSGPNDYYNNALPVLQKQSGDGQGGESGAVLPNPLVVKVMTSGSVPLANAPVVFSIGGSNGQIAAPGTSAFGATLEARTDGNGTASVVSKTSGTVGTTNQVVAQAASGTNSVAVIFSATVENPSLQPPVAPANLLATINSDGSTTLTWEDTSNNEEDFVIKRRREDGTWEDIGVAPANSTSSTIPPPNP